MPDVKFYSLLNLISFTIGFNRNTVLQWTITETETWCKCPRDRIGIGVFFPKHWNSSSFKSICYLGQESFCWKVYFLTGFSYCMFRFMSGMPKYWRDFFHGNFLFKWNLSNYMRQSWFVFTGEKKKSEKKKWNILLHFWR